MGEVLKILNEKKIEIVEFSVSPENLGNLINLINDGPVSGKIAKEIFPKMIETKKEPHEITTGKNHFQLKDDTALQKNIDKKKKSERWLVS